MSHTAIPAGTIVTYHGSLTDYHGYAQIVDAMPDWSELSTDGYRYAIHSVEGELLTNVRRQSITA